MRKKKQDLWFYVCLDICVFWLKMDAAQRQRSTESKGMEAFSDFKAAHLSFAAPDFCKQQTHNHIVDKEAQANQKAHVHKRACLLKALIKGGRYWRQVDWSSSVSSTRAGGSASRHLQRFFHSCHLLLLFCWKARSLSPSSPPLSSSPSRPGAQSASILDSSVLSRLQSIWDSTALRSLAVEHKASRGFFWSPLSVANCRVRMWTEKKQTLISFSSTHSIDLSGTYERRCIFWSWVFPF